MSDRGQRLLKSLCEAPLLVEHLPELASFDRSVFSGIQGGGSLNFEQKLGHLYEDALAQLLEAANEVDLLARNLQVVDSGGRTLGELDFVLWDRCRQQHVHLELAVKFYLAVNCADGWEYPGPDPRDNWQNKLDRLCSHQLKLVDLPDCKRLLAERFNAHSVEVRHLIYGCIFKPLENSSVPLPKEVASNARIGRWLRANDWSKHFPVEVEVYVIPKPLWPVPITSEMSDSLELVPAGRLFQLARERCVLFCFPGSGVPYFLVPTNWFV